MSAVGALVAIGACVLLWPLGPPPRTLGAGQRRFGPLVMIGARTRGVLGGRLPVLAEVSDRALGLAVLSTVVGVVLPPLLVGGPLLVLAVAIVRVRRQRRLRCTRLEVGLSMVIDHLALAVAGGLPLTAAFVAVAPRLPAEHAPLAQRLVDRVERGAALASALQWWGVEIGRAADDLVTVLLAAERDGAPLADGLERAADSARRARRRELERRARRLPVAMLLPLVVCILPAFVLLTLVPVLVGSFRGLSVPG